MTADPLDLTTTRALIAHTPGIMGAGIARRLREAGARVMSDLPVAPGADPRMAIAGAVDAADQELGGGNALVVGWGAEGAGGLLAASDEEIIGQIRANVEEPLWWIQSVILAVERRRATGRIVVLSSVGGIEPSRDGLLFAVTQAAVQTIARVAALEQGRAVQVNTLALGWCEDGPQSRVLERPGTREWVTEDIPTAHVTRVEEVADACAFLLSQAQRSLNGEIVRLDGGYSLTRGSRPSPWPAGGPGPAP